jgi:hypothetical protein
MTTTRDDKRRGHLCNYNDSPTTVTFVVTVKVTTMSSTSLPQTSHQFSSSRISPIFPSYSLLIVVSLLVNRPWLLPLPCRLHRLPLLVRPTLRVKYIYCLSYPFFIKQWTRSCFRPIPRRRSTTTGWFYPKISPWIACS